MTRCLLVDDDAGLRTLLVDLLGRHGIVVEALADGAALRGRLPAPEIDVLVLDLMLPDADGLDLCQWVKRVQPALAVLMLTAKGDPMSRVLGLELGADDYLAKPFEPRELVARIRATLRRGRQAAAPAAETRFGGWCFDRVQRRLLDPEGTVVPLSAAEFRLMCAFADHPGRALDRDTLLALTQGPGRAAESRSIDLAVSRLRAKLAATPRSPAWIRTVRGEGYLFDPHARA